MKLFFAPGACSLSPHIALREAGLAHELVRVDFATKTTSDGRNFLEINTKGYVPALELDDGQLLTEGPAIVQYIADLAPQTGLAPANGTTDRYRLQEWLNFISTEIHKTFGPLFRPTTPSEIKDAARAQLGVRLTWVSQQLAAKPYLTGETFTIADGYLYTVLRWGRMTGVDVAQWPNLAAFVERVGARPAVAAANEAEKASRAKV